MNAIHSLLEHMNGTQPTQADAPDVSPSGKTASFDTMLAGLLQQMGPAVDLADAPVESVNLKALLPQQLPTRETTGTVPATPEKIAEQVKSLIIQLQQEDGQVVKEQLSALAAADSASAGKSTESFDQLLNRAPSPDPSTKSGAKAAASEPPTDLSTTGESNVETTGTQPAADEASTGRMVDTPLTVTDTRTSDHQSGARAAVAGADAESPAASPQPATAAAETKTPRAGSRIPKAADPQASTDGSPSANRRNDAAVTPDTDKPGLRKASSTPSDRTGTSTSSTESQRPAPHSNGSQTANRQPESKPTTDNNATPKVTATARDAEPAKSSAGRSSASSKSSQPTPQAKGHSPTQEPSSKSPTASPSSNPVEPTSNTEARRNTRHAAASQTSEVNRESPTARLDNSSNQRGGKAATDGAKSQRPSPPNPGKTDPAPIKTQSTNDRRGSSPARGRQDSRTPGTAADRRSHASPDPSKPSPDHTETSKRSRPTSSSARTGDTSDSHRRQTNGNVAPSTRQRQSAAAESSDSTRRFTLTTKGSADTSTRSGAPQKSAAETVQTDAAPTTTDSDKAQVKGAAKKSTNGRHLDPSRRTSRQASAEKNSGSSRISIRSSTQADESSTTSQHGNNGAGSNNRQQSEQTINRSAVQNAGSETAAPRSSNSDMEFSLREKTVPERDIGEKPGTSQESTSRSKSGSKQTSTSRQSGRSGASMLSSAWRRAIHNGSPRSHRLENGWHVLTMELDQDKSQMTVKTRSGDDKVSVSVGMSDPKLRSLIAANTDRLQAALRAEYEAEIDFSLSGDDGQSSPDADANQSSDRGTTSGRLTGVSEQGANEEASNQERRALYGSFEWIG